jgi:hypothetical protein
VFPWVYIPKGRTTFCLLRVSATICNRDISVIKKKHKWSIWRYSLGERKWTNRERNNWRYERWATTWYVYACHCNFFNGLLKQTFSGHVDNQCVTHLRKQKDNLYEFKVIVALSNEMSRYVLGSMQPNPLPLLAVFLRRTSKVEQLQNKVITNVIAYQ